MKKIIAIISAIAYSFINSGFIIACRNPLIDESTLSIAIVTDGHAVKDRSFNQSSQTGALKFKAEFDKWAADPSSSAPKKLRNKTVRIIEIQPPAIDLNNLIQSYIQAFFMNSEVTIASGFIQSAALVKAQNETLKNKMRYIFVDGDTTVEQVPTENKNLAGLLYQAEQSGLLASLAAGAWLIAHSDDYDAGNLKMTTFGGLDIPAVTNYMYGFYWGIDLINNSESLSLELNKNFKEWIKVLNPEFDTAKPLPKINFVSLKNNQFTGNFDQGSEQSKALNSEMVASQKVDVIFPVAGPQISDTLGALKASRSKGKVIGVDSDQQLQYPASKDFFLTSAEKNFPDSVNYMLWRAINYDETPEHNPLPNGEEDKIFKNNAIYRGGKDFVGIANNQAISPIYDLIINNDELNKPGGFIEQISQGWKKVLSQTSSNFWDYGRKINPFS